MWISRTTTAIIFPVILWACSTSTPYGGSTYSSGPSVSTVATTPSTRIDVNDDKFNPYVEYRSSMAKYGPPNDRMMWILAAEESRNDDDVQYYMQWAQYYIGDNWRRYYTARTDNAKTLEFVTVARDVGSCDTYTGCSYTETYNIYFPEALMSKGAESGLRFKVMAESGQDKIVKVPSELIKALLEKIHGEVPRAET